MKEYNIALLGVSSQNMNKGCEALLYSELFLLRSLENPERHFNYFLIEGNGRERKIIYNVAGDKIPVTILPNIMTPFPYSLLINAKNHREIKKYKKFDCVLAIGFGDSFADIYGKERFDSINEPIKHCLRRNLKVVLMPQTIGPFQDDVLLKEALRTIEQSKITFPRDKQSLDFINAHTKELRVKEMIDVAFFLPYERHHFKNKKINVGMAISGLLWRGGYTGKNEFGLQVDYKTIMLELIEWFNTQENVQVILTPHVVSGDALCEDDYTLAYNLQKELGEDKVMISPFFKDPIMAKSYISGLDFFIGSRMHACIAAFSSGVPVVPMSYSRKFTGLFKDTLSYHFVADPVSTTQTEVAEMVKSSFIHREELKKQISAAMNGIVKERCEALKEELNNLFS